jgi:enoyl-CoA hydratase/carnithine racemase
MFSSRIADRVATLTMSSPPVNALSESWLAGLSAAIDGLVAQGGWTLLHIRSDQKAFCAGADLKEMKARFDAPDGPDRNFAYVATIQRLFRKIEDLPQATLAEIGGAAMGGGFELALSCDLRVAAAEAKIGLPEVKLGLIPGAGGTQRLTRLIGAGLANRLILGAETPDGSTAERLGLVQWCFPRAEIAERAAEIARRVAALPEGALRAAKACMRASALPGPGGYFDELEETRKLQTDPDTRRLIGAFLAGARG